MRTIEIVDQSKVFSLTEARDILPLIKSITLSHYEELGPIQYKLDRMLSNDPRRARIERQFQAVVDAWCGKISRLGVSASNLWEVEFDVGVEGALNWRHPELDLAYFRPKGQTLRKKLTDYVEENDPDWALL